jgi:hypothetical protein
VVNKVLEGNGRGLHRGRPLFVWEGGMNICGSVASRNAMRLRRDAIFRQAASTEHTKGRISVAASQSRNASRRSLRKVRLQVLTTASMKMAVFWGVGP